MALITNNISGSSSDSWRLGITGSVRIANPGSNPFPAMPGNDVDFFVSGSRGGKGTAGVSVFGGDTVVSGSLTIGTGSITITSNDITFQGGIAQIFSGTGGLTFVDSNGDLTLSEIIAGTSVQPSYWSSVTTGEIFTTGSAVTSGSFSIKNGSGNQVILAETSGDLSVSGSLNLNGNSIKSSTGDTAVTFVGSSVILPGNLVVNGTTTTINTENLTVKDKLIYIASSSAAGEVSYGGIAIASGSNVADQALVFVKVGTNTWGAGRQDVSSGTIDSAAGFTATPIRASEFQVVGTTNALKLDGSDLAVSASNAIDLQFGTGQFVQFQENATNILRVQSGSYSESVNATRVIAQSSKGVILGSTVETALTGSVLYLKAGTSGVVFQRDGSPVFSVVSPNSTTLTMNPGAGLTTTNLVNTNATTVNFAGAATTLAIGNVATVAQTLNLGTASTGSSTYNIGTGATATATTKTLNFGTGGLAGSTTNINLGSTAGTTLVSVSGSLEPGSDISFDLGSPTKRWRNMYTGDLHLRNDRGDWTVIEEETFLSITNNKTGKRYKFLMEEI
jgi:hypothetical protein